MEYLTNAAAFIVVLGLMIFFHEFGHFITAKAFGMRVFVFSFGFGKTTSSARTWTRAGIARRAGTPATSPRARAGSGSSSTWRARS